MGPAVAQMGLIVQSCGDFSIVLLVAFVMKVGVGCTWNKGNVMHKIGARGLE